MLEVTDDSGFLALIDPDDYVGFVHEDWALDQLVAHFKDQMNHQRMLIWGTGTEGWWRVEVSTARKEASAFRDVEGTIKVSAGRLLLTNYESLTMAAQFRDVTLPEEHDVGLLVSLPSATYSCRIAQLFNPDEESSAAGGGPDFLVELLPDQPAFSSWNEIPWSDI